MPAARFESIPRELISSLGSSYVITVEATNAQTGDTIAREQSEAASKEQVLTTLGDTAKKLREKLGESLASIQKYDALIQMSLPRHWKPSKHILVAATST